jgi:hypothetical protein
MVQYTNKNNFLDENGEKIGLGNFFNFLNWILPLMQGPHNFWTQY